jgi:citrate synthase
MRVKALGPKRPLVAETLNGAALNAHPMGMFEAMLGALSTFYPDAKDIFNGESRWKQIYRLIAKVPIIAAFAYHHRIGMQYAYPDNDLGYEGNFLNVMFKTTEAGRVRGSPVDLGAFLR